MALYDAWISDFDCSECGAYNAGHYEEVDEHSGDVDFECKECGSWEGTENATDQADRRYYWG